LHHLAEALDVEIEAVEVVYETEGLDHDVQTGFGTVEAGTASVVRFELRALSGGRPFAVVEHVDCVARDVGKGWKQPFGPADLAYRVEVDGDPSFTLELNFDSRPGRVLSAMPVINSVPAVCGAPPGLLGPLDVPRYWARNAPARQTGAAALGTGTAASADAAAARPAVPGAARPGYSSSPMP